MRPIRHIVSERIPFRVINYAVDDKRFVVRVLEPVESLDSATAQALMKKPANGTPLLLSTSKLAYDNVMMSRGDIKVTFDVEGVRHFVAIEIIFDREKSFIANSWETMANFAFVIKDGVGEVVDTQKESFITRFRTGHNAQYKKQMTLAQIFCRDKTDRLVDCAKSLTTRPDGITITDIPLPEEKTDPRIVTEVRGSSRYLNILPMLTAPKTCKPNELVEVQVQFCVGGTTEKVSGINYDGLIVEAVDGYVPHRRVKIRDGKGSFKARALDLVEGDEMRIKVRTKFYTDKGQCIIKVTSKP